MDDRIDYDEGNLDDVCLRDVECFRLEYMRGGLIWIRCYRKDGKDVIIWLRSRSKIEGRHEEETREKK